jgi:hypothetical protein
LLADSACQAGQKPLALFETSEGIFNAGINDLPTATPAIQQMVIRMAPIS